MLGVIARPKWLATTDSQALPHARCGSPPPPHLPACGRVTPSFQHHAIRPSKCSSSAAQAVFAPMRSEPSRAVHHDRPTPAAASLRPVQMGFLLDPRVQLMVDLSDLQEIRKFANLHQARGVGLALRRRAAGTRASCTANNPEDHSHSFSGDQSPVEPPKWTISEPLWKTVIRRRQFHSEFLRKKTMWLSLWIFCGFLSWG